VPRVELRGITKRYGRITALKDINLSLEDGEYVTVLGSTGAGKTTLLHTICGIVRPDAGDIYIDGERVNDKSPEKRGIAYFPQDYALFPHMTILENAAYGLLVKGMPEEGAYKEALRILELVGLERRAEALPHELSGGMQQRAALARALMTGSKLLLLDEPLSALDAILRVELRYELKRMAENLDLTVIHVTNDQAEALAIADRVVVLRRGVIEQFGTPVEIYDKPRNIYVANFVGDMNFYEGVVVARDGVGVTVEVGGYPIHVDAQPEGENVVIGIRPEDVEISTGEEVGRNWVPGRILDITFSTGILTILVQLSNEREILVKRASPFLWRSVAKGSTVSIRLEPDKILLFPYPSGGLLRALEVE
jgi:ABC-type Fe3+/spermidine/putrescine transport system ATPase subunit